MVETINRNLLQYAVGRAITCTQCATHHVMDMRDSVLVTLHAPDKDREYVMCGAAWDAVKQPMFDTWSVAPYSVEAIDGRELFPARKTSARKPRPTPGTPQERHERIVAALTAYDRRQRALMVRNPRRSHNPNALALYFQGLERAEHSIEAGMPVAKALSEVFLGALLTAVLRAIGEVA